MMLFKYEIILCKAFVNVRQNWSRFKARLCLCYTKFHSFVYLKLNRLINTKANLNADAYRSNNEDCILMKYSWLARLRAASCSLL